MAKETNAQKLKQLQAEVKVLRAENTRLKSRGDTTQKQKKHPLKATISLFFVCVSLALLLVANIFLWAGNTIFNTNNYVRTVNPIIEQPEVQVALADIATEKIFQNVNVENYLAENLPPRTAFLAPQLTQQLQNQVKNGFSTALASDRFQDTWKQVNEKQHARILAFIKNYEGDGNISVSEIYSQLQGNLADTPLSFLSDRPLPERVGSIQVVDAPRLPLYHDIATNLSTIRWLSLGFAAIFLALALWLSKNRRRTYYLFVGGVVCIMLATLLTLRILQASVAGNVESQYADAMRISTEILTSGLRTQSIIVLVFAVLTACIIWISGTSKRVLQAKDWFRNGVGTPLHDSVFKAQESKITHFVGRQRRILEWAVFLVSTAILLYAPLSVASILWWLFGLVVAILLIEFIGAESKTRGKK